MRARMAASAAPSVDRGQHEMRKRPAPADRQPAELDGKHNREQRPKPEVRNRDADERQGHRAVVDRPCRARRRR